MKSLLNLVESPKIFCIGLNKTGTTTIEAFFRDYKYSIGTQMEAEYLLHDWYNRKFKSIIKYCKTADAFQDVPFSLSYTYVILDHYFPKAKFILTVRDSPEQWYDSLVSFHSKLWGNGVDILTTEQLKSAKYLYKGYPYEANRAMFTTPEDDPYNKKILIDHYNSHIQNVREYFRSQPEKLIVVNVSIKNDYFRLCEFLGKTPKSDNFSWKNKTKK